MRNCHGAKSSYQNSQGNHRVVVRILLIWEIAAIIGYSLAAVSREIKRNSYNNGTYDAEASQRRADSGEHHKIKMPENERRFSQRTFRKNWLPAGRRNSPPDACGVNSRMSRSSILPSRRFIVGSSRTPNNTRKEGRSGATFVTFATKGPANSLSMTKSA